MTLKEAYTRASQKRDYHFEEEVLEYLRSFVKDNERKIEGNKKRLELADENPEMQTKVSIAVYVFFWGGGGGGGTMVLKYNVLGPLSSLLPFPPPLGSRKKFTSWRCR